MMNYFHHFQKSNHHLYLIILHLLNVVKDMELKLLFVIDIDSSFGVKIELEYDLNKDIVQILNLPEEYQYVTHDEYSCPRYPTFLSGFGYLISFKLSPLFVNKNVDYLYQSKCNTLFFISHKNPFACATSNDYFNRKESSRDRSFMNDYNFYWTKLSEKYNTFKISPTDVNSYHLSLNFFDIRVLKKFFEMKFNMIETIKTLLRNR